MTRRTARELAMLVTASLGPEESGEEALNRFFEEEHFRSLASEGEVFSQLPDKRQFRYIQAVVTGAAERREELDETIRAYSHGWRVERLSAVVRAVLRCALFELRFLPEEFREEVPERVAINEAVELTKKYGGEEAPAFVNGVLGGFVRSPKPDPEPEAKTAPAPDVMTAPAPESEPEPAPAGGEEDA